MTDWSKRRCGCPAPMNLMGQVYDYSPCPVCRAVERINDRAEYLSAVSSAWLNKAEIVFAETEESVDDLIDQAYFYQSLVMAHVEDADIVMEEWEEEG